MKIRAAVLEKMGETPPYATSKPLSIVTVDLAPPGHGEILVKIASAGLCHSDLSVINGDRPRPMPMALGHEAAGVVGQLGEGVSDLKIGDHVVVVFVPSCGHCAPCAEGRPALREPGAAAMLSLPAVSLVAEERTLKGSYIGTCVPSRDIPRYLDLYAQGRLPVDKLLSGRLRLDDINHGFDLLHEGKAIRQVVVFP